MESVEAMIESARHYRGAMVVVTHSEYILRALVTRLVVFEGEFPQVVEGGYDYFLEKCGWHAEAPVAPSAEATRRQPRALSRPTPVASPREDKRERARLIGEKSRVLKPLKTAIDAIEARICALEGAIAAANDAIIRASAEGEGKKIADHSRAIAAAQREINERFAELERVSEEYETKRKEFQQRLGGGE